MVKKQYYGMIVVCSSDTKNQRDVMYVCMYFNLFYFIEAGWSENQMQSFRGKYFENEEKQYTVLI